MVLDFKKSAFPGVSVESLNFFIEVKLQYDAEIDQPLEDQILFHVSKYEDHLTLKFLTLKINRYQ